MRKKVILILAAILVLAGSYYFFIKKDRVDAPTTDNSNSSQAAVNGSSGDIDKYTIDNQASIYYIVNKNRPLPLEYEPKDLVTPKVPLAAEDSPKESMLRSEAAKSVEQLFAAAQAAGYKVILASGYRSSDLQAYYYNGYVKRDGQAAADKYSARPGTSEHQTGLAFDIARSDRRCYLEICFGNLPEGQWLVANAHKYGFVLRYPNGKENITGYQYEPWHFRYVGTDLADKVQASGKTLEEYFGLN